MQDSSTSSDRSWATRSSICLLVVSESWVNNCGGHTGGLFLRLFFSRDKQKRLSQKCSDRSSQQLPNSQAAAGHHALPRPLLQPHVPAPSLIFSEKAFSSLSGGTGGHCSISERDRAMATSRSSDGASGLLTFHLFCGSFLVAPFRFKPPTWLLKLKDSHRERSASASDSGPLLSYRKQERWTCLPHCSEPTVTWAFTVHSIPCELIHPNPESQHSPCTGGLGSFLAIRCG